MSISLFIYILYIYDLIELFFKDVKAYTLTFRKMLALKIDFPIILPIPQ